MAGFLFQLVRNQWITAGADNMPMDMNIPALLEVIDLYEVEDRQGMFLKLLSAGRKLIDVVREKAKKK